MFFTRSGNPAPFLCALTNIPLCDILNLIGSIAEIYMIGDKNMKNFKKIFALVLCVVMAVCVLTGCEDDPIVVEEKVASSAEANMLDIENKLEKIDSVHGTEHSRRQHDRPKSAGGACPSLFKEGKKDHSAEADLFKNADKGTLCGKQCDLPPR